MADANIRFAKLKKILESFGIVVSGGEGSEAKFSDPNRTRKIMRIGKHGKNPEIARQVVSAIRRKFQLDAGHDVADKDFYGRS